MSGYVMVLGFIAIVVIAFLRIPLNEVINTIGTTFNNMTTDTDTINRNNMAVSAFFYTLFFMVIAVIIWIIKSSLDSRGNIYEYA